VLYNATEMPCASTIGCCRTAPASRRSDHAMTVPSGRAAADGSDGASVVEKALEIMRDGAARVVDRFFHDCGVLLTFFSPAANTCASGAPSRGGRAA